MTDARILIVEDERIVAQDIQQTLIDLGYAAADLASSGEEALAKIAECSPDLVLMDIRLSGELNGIETAQQIHEQFHLPVIYLTAYADEETLQRAKITEPFNYILKPFEEQTLSINIEMALYKHKMEKELKVSEERFRALIENAADLVLITDTNGTIRYLSPSAQNLMGYDAETALGQNVRTFVHPHDMAWVNAALTQALQKPGLPLSTEARVRAADGSWRVVEGITQNLLDHPAVAGIIITARDITRRKQLEEALKQREAEYRATIDAMDEFVYVLDRDLRFVLYNRRLRDFAAQVGAEDNLVGKGLFDLFPFLSDKTRQEYRQVLKTREAHFSEETTKMGQSTVRTDMRKIPILNRRGQVYRIVTIVSGPLR